jgi:hypothetical protein
MVYRTHDSPVSQADRRQIRVDVHCVYEKGLSHRKTLAKAVTKIYEEANMLSEQGMGNRCRTLWLQLDGHFSSLGAST